VPPNKGLRYPADPPTVEEIILVMREAGPGPYADRTRGLIAILWRAGLRISEALALTESDLDAKTGSVLVRAGKGGKRRMVGMDEWGWEHIARWTEHRVELPIGPLFCILAGATRGRAWSATAARGELRRLAALAGVRRRFAPHQFAARSCNRDGALRDPVADHSEAARACAPRDYVDLSPRNRHARDRRHGPPPAASGNPGQCRPSAITPPTQGT
jgi:integrase